MLSVDKAFTLSVYLHTVVILMLTVVMQRITIMIVVMLSIIIQIH